MQLDSNKVRDCTQVIERIQGFFVNSNQETRSVGKQAVNDYGPTKDYYECVAMNAKLNEQRILQLTQKLLMLTKR